MPDIVGLHAAVPQKALLGSKLLDWGKDVRLELAVGELLKLPADTFGGAYARFALAYDLDPEFFAVPPDLEGEEAFVQWRTSQTHDVWHTLTGYDTSVLGEVALAAFIAAQRPNLCMAVIVLGGACLVASRDSSRLPAVVRGWRRGRKAQPLFPVYWEQLWELPLDEVRARLGVEPERDPKLAYRLI